MKFMRRLVLGLLIFAGLWGSIPVGKTLANDSVVFTDMYVDFQFGDAIEFTFSFESSLLPETVWLMIEPDTMERKTFEIPVEMEDGIMQSSIKIPNLPLKAFSVVDYWYQIEFEAGRQVSSEVSTFMYTDNRFEWQTVETDHFVVHWTQGDLNFATKALNIAEASLVHLTEKFSTVLNYPVELYVYADSKALQETLSLGNLHWVAG